ncbi:MAG: 23S rRNA (guanosine(2251)-2'-O)-methyltransferase RlmB [Candidatus Margulisbacteria bacterium]|nr:23S rRNA (guanosine(2251)-2'-O)-methyltransferase RlmB [Candidatus Margulisiibacteriota bacterium]
MKEKIKLVRNLLEKRRARRKEGLFVVEGPHLVQEAADLIKFVIYSQELPILVSLREKGIECLRVSRQKFEEISEVASPQGILAVVKEQPHELKDLLAKKDPLIIFCAEVQDPGNLGTIIRSADAVGAAGIILSRGTVDLYNPKVIRSTMGSLFHLPIVLVDDVVETLAALKKKQIQIIATAGQAKVNYFDVDYKKGTAILVGNEGAGLAEDLIKKADKAVKIPMPGKAESLNVGVSTAVVLYEALRQRSK